MWGDRKRHHEDFSHLEHSTPHTHPPGTGAAGGHRHGTHGFRAPAEEPQPGWAERNQEAIFSSILHLHAPLQRVVILLIRHNIPPDEEQMSFLRTEGRPPSITGQWLACLPLLASRGPSSPGTRRTKLTPHSSSSKQTAMSSQSGWVRVYPESKLARCCSYSSARTYFPCSPWKQPSSPWHSHPADCSLARCFSVILMAGSLFTAEALIWGYAMSKFKGRF